MAAAGVLAYAQNTDAPMATLQHGDQTQVFTGTDAFIAAYNAADSGDVITLSAGNFNGVSTISKSISVYGAGFERDEETNTNATVISSSFHLQHGDIVDSDGNTITGARKVNGSHFEGLSINSISLGNSSTSDYEIKDIAIAKCHIRELTLYPGAFANLTIRQSQISTFRETGWQQNAILTNLYIANSHIGFDGHSRFSTSSTIHIDHCLIMNMIETPALFTNSILYSSLPSGSTAKNNIFIGKGSAIGGGVQDMNNNWTDVAAAGIFAADGEDGTYAADKTFELKYPDKYIGTDGTQVGLHGGNYPWNKIPCIPRITESDIDTRTSADGKLKIYIKAEAQTKD